MFQCIHLGVVLDEAETESIPPLSPVFPTQVLEESLRGQHAHQEKTQSARGLSFPRSALFKTFIVIMGSLYQK